MKLKKLTIHNIASIEDATIDFANGMLAGQDLFLICGPTGSGKTTILDAICLALFNTTPRINNSKNDLLDNTLDDDKGKDQNRMKNVMHLVRKNAVDAKVELTFEGIDGKECKAVWEVKRKVRAGKAAQARFQNETLEQRLKRDVVKEWSVTDGDGDTTQGEKATAAKIQEIIKMDFEQFCKTTMLAQGEFTKFLTSDSEDKAKILERILGTNLYSAVGEIINTTANSKNNEVRAKQNQLRDIVLLSDEERSNIEAKIVNLNAEINKLGNERQAITAKLNWIKARTEAVNAENAANEALQRANQALETDEVKADQRTIALWDMTAELRSAIAAKKRAESDTVTNDAKKAELAESYDRAMAALRWLNERIALLTDQKQKLQASIDAQSQFAEMFGNAAVICATHDNIVADQNCIAENEPHIIDYDKQLGKTREQIADLENQKAEAESEIKAIEEANVTRTEQLQVHRSDTIDAEVRALNNRRLLVTDVENLMTQRNEAQNDYDQKMAEAEQASARLALLVKTEADKKQQHDTAIAQCKESHELYQKAYAAISDHAMALRATLQVGDDCPVCGNKIEHLITDEALAATLQPIEDKWHADESKERTAIEEHAHAKAALDQGTKEAAEREKAKNAAQRNLQQKVDQLASRCQELKINCDENVAESLAVLKDDIETAQRAIDERQKVISAIRQAIEQANTQIANIRQQRVKPIEDILTRLRGDEVTITKQRAEAAGAVERARAGIQQRSQQLNVLINHDWRPEDEGRFFEQLKADAEAFEGMRRELAECERVLSNLTIELGHIDDSKNAVEALFGEWATRPEVLPAQADHPAALWASLLQEANTLANAIKQTGEALAKSEAAISAFESANPDIRLCDVAALLDLADSVLAYKRKRIDALKTACSEAQGQYQAAKKRLEELAESPLGEGETKETLNQNDADKAQCEREYSQKVGALRTTLENDRSQHERYGAMQAEYDRLLAEANDWGVMNQYLGSTGGKRFCNIAQSFILSDLLDKANAYLANISTRYTLFCNPGTLTIMMRDAYQGGVVRTTNTLSGGESFIISLSLALGLSSMQNVDFEVDTLFIDEGFGTLSPEFLDPVIVALKRLHDVYGRRVGIISHVDSLRSRIPAAIEVSKSGHTSSQITLTLA